MSRKRWIYRDGEPIEIPADYEPPPAGADHVLWNDRSYQDMGDPRFASRSAHRRYMAQRGLTTADDFTGEWKQARQQRDRFYTGAPDPQRPYDIARAIEQTKRRK